MTLSSQLEECRKRAIREALERCDFNQCHAAKELGIHRNTLVRQLQKMNVWARRGIGIEPRK